MTLTAQLNQKDKAILIRELGPVDYARFIQRYTQAPDTFACPSIEEVVTELGRIGESD